MLKKGLIFTIIFIFNLNTASAQLAMPVFSSADVEAKIRQVFPGANVMIDIARCESGLKQYKENFNVVRGGLGGNYIGIFQLAESHAENARNLGLDIYSVDGNIGYAKVLYDAQGTQPWVACTKVSPSVAEQVVSVSASNPLTMNLQIGAVNEQVRTLQKLLNASGFPLAANGPGSPGNETSIFGSVTRAAVQKFQCAQNIVCLGSESTTGYGRFGPKTRSALLQYPN